MNNGYQKSNGCGADKEGGKIFNTFFYPELQSKHVRPNDAKRMLCGRAFVKRINFNQMDNKQKEWVECVSRAKKVLKQGDRIRVTHCPGTKRTITFDHWDGNWIVSKSGKDDYSAMSIDRLNGQPISFKETVS